MLSSASVIDRLEKAVPHGVSRDAPLASQVRWKIGGRALALVEPRKFSEVAAVHRIMKDSGLPLFLMGDASNLLFDSAGYDGVIMRIGRAMSDVRIDGMRIVAQAGVWIPRLAHAAANAGLSGLEHTVGIPGTLGGLILMNGGSQRKGVGLNVRKVDCIDENGDFVSLSHEECGFSYRTSALQSLPLTVIGAELELAPGQRSTILRQMIDIMVSRRTRFPKSLPNGGSTFLSDPALYSTLGPPGKVIEELGFKGAIKGDAQVSPQHANFIVNNGRASSADVLYLIYNIRSETFKKTGIWMNTEVRYVARDGKVRPAHLAAHELYGCEAGDGISSAI